MIDGMILIIMIMGVNLLPMLLLLLPCCLGSPLPRR
jgi:hypothetical protein